VPGQGPLVEAHGLPFEPYSASLAPFERSVNQLNGTGVDPAREFDFFVPDSALSTPSFMTFPESSPGGDGQGWGSETETASTHSRRSSRRVSAKFQAIEGGFDASGRPCTPSGQITNGTYRESIAENADRTILIIYVQNTSLKHQPKRQ
jgi:regulatory protein SWI5